MATMHEISATSTTDPNYRARGIYSALLAAGLAEDITDPDGAGGRLLEDGKIVTFKSPFCDKHIRLMIGYNNYSDVYYGVGTYDASTDYYGVAAEISRTIFWGGSITRINLWTDPNFFAIDTDTGFVYFGKCINGDSSTNIAFSLSGSQSHLGVTFVDELSKSNGNLVLEKNPVNRDSQICCVPAFITDADNILMGQLPSGICNACTAIGGSYDGYYLVKYDYCEISTSVLHKKYTALRLG